MASQTLPAYDPANDLIDRLLGLNAADPLYAVRHQRDKVAAATQGSYDALFDPDLPGLALTDRLLVAQYACRISDASELAAHYRERLVKAGASADLLALADGGAPEAARDARLAAILAYTRTLIENPVEGDRAALDTLPAAGLSTPAVVTLSQLIAFLSYQTRLLAGLKAMKALEQAA